MELVVVAQNFGRGGLKTGAGVPEDRWPKLVDRVKEPDPDVVLGQEAEGWAAEGHRQLVRAEDDLEMDALLPPSRSGLGPVTLYRRDRLGRRRGWNTDYAKDEMHHGMGVAAFDVGLPALLAAVSLHLTPYSAAKAAMEADFAASRAYKYGPYAIIGGDVNFSPQAGPDPRYEQMRPYNIGSRTVHTDPELGLPLSPQRDVAWTLAANGFVDVAWHRYKQSGDEDLLRPTCAEDRIDQIWVSRALVPAITGYRLLDSPPGASDHDGVAAVLDLSLAVTDDPWDYR